MSEAWTSYPKVYNLGHPAIGGLLLEPCVVQEKVDGSQFSFGLIDGQLRMRSRGREFDPNAPDDLFKKAAAHVLANAERLVPGWAYRGEVIAKPKHNTLMYGRVPRGNVALFDISVGLERYADPATLAKQADILDMEVVPLLMEGTPDLDWLRAQLDRESFLGGAKIEGLVIKNYARFGKDGHALMGKHVSDGFKELNQTNWKSAHPQNKDIKQILCDTAPSRRRWEKAVERLRDDGRLLGDPKDIGPLMHEVQKDAEAELKDLVMEKLWEWIRKDLVRASSRGLPEWYKDRLMVTQFEPTEPAAPEPSS